MDKKATHSDGIFKILNIFHSCHIFLKIKNLSLEKFLTTDRFYGRDLYYIPIVGTLSTRLHNGSIRQTWAIKRRVFMGIITPFH